MDEPTLRPLFPAADEIPEDFRPGAQLRQRSWLAVGALREHPLLSEAQRIACIEDFTARMRVLKPHIVNLIMWETGKRHAEAVKQLLDSIVLGHKSKFINTRFIF